MGTPSTTASTTASTTTSTTASTTALPTKSASRSRITATMTPSTTSTIISTSTRKAIKRTTKKVLQSPIESQDIIEQNNKQNLKDYNTDSSTTKGNDVVPKKMYTYSMGEATTMKILAVDSNSETIDEDETDDIIVEPVPESTVEEEIEIEISQGIDQLKSELKMLLAFNHNVLNASNEIIKEATKAKVEHFFESVSTSLNLLNFQKNIHKGEKTTSSPKQQETKKKEEINTATSILNITADISRTLASTVEIGSKVDVKLPNISMTVMKKKMGTNNS